MDLSNLSVGNLYNLERFWDWMNSTNRCEIVYWEMSGPELRSLIDKDVIDYYSTSIISSLSELIDFYWDIDDETKHNFVHNTTNADWFSWVNQDNYHCYQLFKVAWLMKDLRKNGQQAPVQVIKTIESYQCHPGSDKKYAMTLLDPRETIRCFYIWYPEIDPDPWHQHHEHRKITTMEEFADMFEKVTDPSFNFEYGNVDFTTDGFNSSTHFEPFARSASELLLKQAMREQREFDPFSVKHLSYRDSVHRLQMEAETHLLEKIYFDGPDVFYLDGIRFDLITGPNYRLWMPEMYNRLPTSPIQDDWTYDPLYSIKFQLNHRDR